jgi:hypothetical protein
VAAPVENAVLQWEDGYAVVREARTAGGPRAAALGRLTIAVERDLRKRLGSRFSIDELATVYREQADMLLDDALATLPEGAPVTDASAACDAAFYLYMREASDFGGGRRRRDREA